MSEAPSPIDGAVALAVLTAERDTLMQLQDELFQILIQKTNRIEVAIAVNDHLTNRVATAMQNVTDRIRPNGGIQ